jgi:hypothetical protein
MTINNIKDQPNLPRTDDTNTILHNFVEYYSKLYEHKKVCPVVLDRFIKNLTLMLDTKVAKELDKSIMISISLSIPQRASLQGRTAFHTSAIKRYQRRRPQHLWALAT